MFTDFPQLVPQKICLSCRGCCRFKEASSLWRPKMAPSEIQAGINKKAFTEAIGKDGYIKTAKEQGQDRCTFLDLGTNKCGVYTGRPFECRLYPFLLTRSPSPSPSEKEKENGENGRVAVSVHWSCPYVQQSRYSAEFENYLTVVMAYFSDAEVARFLRDNPALAGDYSEYRDEIEELFTLEPA